MEAIASRYWTGMGMQWMFMRQNIIKKKWKFSCASVSNESKCETIHLKVSSAYRFLFMQIKVIFVLKQRHKGTRKWPILSAVGKTTHISLSYRLIPVHIREYQYNLSLLRHLISVWNLYMYIFVLQLIGWLGERFFYQNLHCDNEEI